MVEAAGRVADGLLGHALFTVPYLEDVVLPAIQRGVDRTFVRRDLPAMVAAVPDRMVDAIALAGGSAEVRTALRRFDGLLDHVILYSPSFSISAERASANAHALIAAFAEDRGDG